MLVVVVMIVMVLLVINGCVSGSGDDCDGVVGN